MGNRGDGKNTYALYEELKHLRVSPDAETPYIYKRLDVQKNLSVEDRTWQIRIPIPKSRSIRKSLRTSDKSFAVMKAEEMVIEIKVQLKQGGSAFPFPVENLVAKFLVEKAHRIRGEWEGKEDAGRKSITQQRFQLIEGKLRNYLIPFLGSKTDVRGVPVSKFKNWERWRKEHNTRKEMGMPKAVTIQNEMGVIRECWRWGMDNGYIPLHPKLPFHDENLISDDKMRRDTWEANEWNSFSRKLRDWLNSVANKNEDNNWDAFVAYQMVFFLANSGMRLGEVVKVRNKDVRFYKRQTPEYRNKEMVCVLVQVHKSTKTGAREVNAMGGEFAKRIFVKSKFQRKNDFLFAHLDGSPFTTKQFRTWFQRMIAFTDENERWGKEFVPYSLRHLYATTRLQNGTSKGALCENMGVTEPYLRKHYSHYLTRLATDDLMKINKSIGLGGKVFSKDDFLLPEPSK